LPSKDWLGWSDLESAQQDQARHQHDERVKAIEIGGEVSGTGIAPF